MYVYTNTIAYTSKRMFERARIRNLYSGRRPLTLCGPDLTQAQRVLVVQGSEALQTPITVIQICKHKVIYHTVPVKTHTHICIYMCTYVSCFYSQKYTHAHCTTVQSRTLDIQCEVSVFIFHSTHSRMCIGSKYFENRMCFFLKKSLWGLGGLRLKWHWPNIVTCLDFQSTIWLTLVAKFSMIILVFFESSSENITPNYSMAV